MSSKARRKRKTKPKKSNSIMPMWIEVPKVARISYRTIELPPMRNIHKNIFRNSKGNSSWL